MCLRPFPLPVTCACTAVSHSSRAQARGQVGRPRTRPPRTGVTQQACVGAGTKPQVTLWGRPRGPGVRQACHHVTAAPCPGCMVSSKSQPLRAPGSHLQLMTSSGQNEVTQARAAGAPGHSRLGRGGVFRRRNRKLQALGPQPAAHALPSLHQAVHAQPGAPQDPRWRESGLRCEWLVAVGRAGLGRGGRQGPCQRGRSRDLWAGRSQRDGVQHRRTAFSGFRPLPPRWARPQLSQRPQAW